MRRLGASSGRLRGSEACVRTSKGGKARLGKASQRFCDRMGDDLGGSEKTPLPPGGNFISRIPPEKPDSEEASARVRRMTTAEGMKRFETKRMK